MDPTNGPVGPQFTEKALNKSFSFSFTRKQLIVLFNALQPMQLPLGDLRTTVLLEIMDEIKRTAIQSITENDYQKQDTLEETNAVQTN